MGSSVLAFERGRHTVASVHGALNRDIAVRTRFVSSTAAHIVWLTTDLRRLRATHGDDGHGRTGAAMQSSRG